MSKSHNKYLRKVKKILPLILILIFSSGFFNVLEAQIPPRPEPPRLVNDFAGLLNESERTQLEQRLVAYSDSTSTQIAVVIMPDLYGYDPDDMAQRIGQEWGVGQKSTSNGLIILVKPKTGSERGYAAISTGYGLEEVITDAVSRRIVDNAMIPRFKEGNYYEGIVAGVNIVTDLLLGKYKAEDYGKGKGTKGGGFIIIIIIIIIFILSMFNKNRDDNHTIGRKGGGLPFWLLLSMLGNSGGRSNSGDWGGFSGGSGGFGGGGFGGGGFGGFGGGGFGGGGASGSW